MCRSRIWNGKRRLLTTIRKGRDWPKRSLERKKRGDAPLDKVPQVEPPIPFYSIPLPVEEGIHRKYLPCQEQIRPEGSGSTLPFPVEAVILVVQYRYPDNQFCVDQCEKSSIQKEMIDLIFSANPLWNDEVPSTPLLESGEVPEYLNDLVFFDKDEIKFFDVVNEKKSGEEEKREEAGDILPEPDINNFIQLFLISLRLLQLFLLSVVPFMFKMSHKRICI